MPAGVCPTQTTAVPVPMTLQVALQRPNAPPPDPAWAVPVTFALYPPGDANTICHQWELTLDQNGRWSGLLDLFTGIYDARLRNLHTLRNVKRNVAILGPATINMGTLREGDANADNSVNILDFALLRNAYFQDEGMPGFDPRADFDENNTVNILDFGLLRGSYFMDGDIEVGSLATEAAMARPLEASAPDASAGGLRASASALATTAAVTLTLTPLRADLALGASAEFIIRVDASAQPLQGLDVELYYRPTVVTVVDAAVAPATSITAGAVFPVVLQNRVDTANRRILFSAASFDQPASGLIEVARFRLRGESPGPAELNFSSRTVGMDASYRRVALTLPTPSVTVGWVSDYRAFFPVMAK